MLKLEILDLTVRVFGFISKYKNSYGEVTGIIFLWSLKFKEKTGQITNFNSDLWSLESNGPIEDTYFL